MKGRLCVIVFRMIFGLLMCDFVHVGSKTAFQITVYILTHDEKPIEFALVILESNGRMIGMDMTDENGKCVFEWLGLGQPTMLVRIVGNGDVMFKMNEPVCMRVLQLGENGFLPQSENGIK